ncbi:MAG: hypothetical protein QM710_14750 [Flavobacterium sp.]
MNNRIKTFALSFTALLLLSSKCFYGSDAEGTTKTPESLVDTVSVPNYKANEEHRRDSIAEAEKKRQLMEEDIQRKKIDAEASISAFSNQLMKVVSPASGKNLDYYIIDEESSYNQVTGTYTGVFETSWDAYPEFFTSKYERHVFKGRIMLYENGEIRYQEISRNAALARGAESTKAANELARLLNSVSQNSGE